MIKFVSFLISLSIAVCCAEQAFTQIPCLAEQRQLIALQNELRELEGLPRLPPPGSSSPSHPLRPDSPNSPAPQERDAEAIMEWHREHDAEVNRLVARIKSPACRLPNAPPKPEDPHPYNLVWSAFDDNSIPFSPEWKSWLTPPLFTGPDPSQCADGHPWQFPCTTQKTHIDNNKGLCPTGALGGHANWIPATFVGRISWESHSLEYQDDDYNFNLFPLIPQSQNPWITASDHNGLHMEFDSDETIDHFHTPWWKKFHADVDDDDSRSIANPLGEPRREMVRGTSKAQADVTGNYAIVSGLMGLDCAHNCGAEVHPVWALAIHVKDDPADDVWVFFFRNWGNEGYCSQGSERIDLQQFTFRLPWRNGANAFDIIGSDFRSRRKDDSWSWDPRPSEKSVLITLSIARQDQGDRMNGEIHLRWRGNPARSLIPKMINQASVASTKPREEDDEDQAAAGFFKLNTAQRSVFLSNLPKRDLTEDSETVLMKRQLANARPAVIPPTTVASDQRGEERSRQRIEALRKVQIHRR